MQKKMNRRVISLLVIVSMMAAFGFVPSKTNAASLTNISDTMADSDVSATTTHSILFTTATDLTAGHYMEVTFPGPFGDVEVGNITCPANTTATAESTEKARCEVTAGHTATSSVAYTIAVVIKNPAAVGSQTINITTYTNLDASVDTGDAMVSIVDTVVVSATVPATLTFGISPVASGVDVNGINTTVESATASMAFGDLVVGTDAVMGQNVTVSTNADAGFTVTIEQDGNLRTPGGADIDAFVNGVASTTAQDWANPAAQYDQEATYGHFAITTEDTELSDADLDFGANQWKGLNTTTPLEVMYHDGPANGATAGVGAAKVGYRLNVSALQEAGDYSNTITYVVTPIF